MLDAFLELFQKQFHNIQRLEVDKSRSFLLAIQKPQTLTPDAYVVALKKFAMVLLTSESTSKDFQIWERFKKAPFWPTFHLTHALYALIEHLLYGKTPEDFLDETKGFSHWLENETLQSFNMLSESFILLFFGLKEHKRAYLEKFCDRIEQYRMHQNSDNTLYYGLFSKESQAGRVSLVACDTLAFTLYAELTGEEEIFELAKNRIEELKPLLSDRQDEHFFFLSILAQKIKSMLTHSDPSLYKPMKNKPNPYFQESGPWKMALKLQGVNTGLGAISKKGGGSIVSFGPHRSPLGDSSQYGIFRIKEEEKRIREHCLAGWSRLLSSTELGEAPHRISKNLPSFDWVHTALEDRGATCFLKMDFLLSENTKPLYCALFLKGERLVTKNQTFVGGSLEQYSGDYCDTTLIKGDSELRLSPEGDGEMHIIPLEGKNYFWGADFLLAFSVTPKRPSFQCTLI